MFNRFWRGDPSRSRLTGGTGLGLAISLEDARLHGGWLQAWGERGGARSSGSPCRAEPGTRSSPHRCRSSRIPWLTCRGAPHERAISAASGPRADRALSEGRALWSDAPAARSGLTARLTAARSGHTHIRTLVAVLAALTVALTACAGVPERSAPERVRAIGGSTASPVPTPSPQPGADPRAIVLGFLAANVSSLPDHNAAKGFLTPEARNNWWTARG